MHIQAMGELAAKSTKKRNVKILKMEIEEERKRRDSTNGGREMSFHLQSWAKAYSFGCRFLIDLTQPLTPF